MRRNSLVFLNNWYKKKNKPLILRGARQTGKSTLVRLFCESENIPLVEVNLEKIKLTSLTTANPFSVHAVIEEIELLTRKKLTEGSILFIDEIQEQPIAINRLRYFYEELPNQKIIVAGSLLEVILKKENFSMPVGRVDYHQLGPMTFLEFLNARGEDILVEKINQISLDIPPSEFLISSMTPFLKEYFFVGGMPEAVREFCETKDFNQVRQIQLSILQTYRDDIPKYTKNSESQKVQAVYDYVPAHLGEEKVKYSDILEGRSDLIKNAIDLLHDAGIIYRIFNNKCSGLPLSSFKDDSSLKLFFLDIGLYNAIMGVSAYDLFQLDSEKLLTRGKMAEQFVAQHLSFRYSTPIQNTLYYWLRGSARNASEVDFIISEEGKILPIEVKSGASGKMRSLHQFIYETKINKAIRIDLKYRLNWVTSIEHTVHDKKIQFKLLGLPLFAIEKLIDLVKDF